MGEVAVLNLCLVTDDNAEYVTGEVLNEHSADWNQAARELTSFVESRLANGVKGAKFSCWVDRSSGGTNQNPGETSGSETLKIDSNSDLGTSDTVTVGEKTLTWGTDMSIGSGGSAKADSTDNLAAAINADADLKGLFSASSDGTDTVTVTAYGSQRLRRHLGLAVSDTTAMTASNSHFGNDDTTDKNEDSAVELSGGLA